MERGTPRLRLVKDRLLESGPEWLRALLRRVDSEDMQDAEAIAKAFHEAYERRAPDFGYKTREASAVPWDEVPEQNRKLMIAVAQELIDRRVIAAGGWRQPFGFEG